MTREEAIKILEIIDMRFMTLDVVERQALVMAIKALEQEPCDVPEQSKIKIGHWIKCDMLQEFKCSECRVCFRNKSNYCPHCGAKMEEAEITAYI